MVKRIQETVQTQSSKQISESMNTRRVFDEIEAETEAQSICTIENSRLFNNTHRFKKSYEFHIIRKSSISFVTFHFYF